MRPTLAAFALLVLLTQNAHADAAGDVILVLPHPLHAGESASVVLQVGAIARGQEIDVTTGSGRALGTISPLGIRTGQAAGIYTLPLPDDAFQDGRVSLRLSMTQFGAPPRPPTIEEVRRVTLTISGAR